MGRTIPIELTNMIMIENPETKEILVEDRKNPAWSGVTFPGGHVESGETIVDSAIREAHEETGLNIIKPRLVGIKEWQLQNEGRYIVFLFKTINYTGELQNGREGKVFWTNRDNLKDLKTAPTFLEMLPVFDQPEISELFLADALNGDPKLSWL